MLQMLMNAQETTDAMATVLTLMAATTAAVLRPDSLVLVLLPSTPKKYQRVNVKVTQYSTSRVTFVQRPACMGQKNVPVQKLALA